MVTPRALGADLRSALGSAKQRAMGRRGASIGLALAAAASPAVAAEADSPDPICADRPGVATPTCTVPAGMVQVETTLTDWARDRSGGVRSDALAIGESAVKLGLTDRLHVELGIAPFVRSRVRESGERETASGFGDMEIAAKYRLTGDAAPVQVAIRPFVKLPTAKRALGNGKVEGGVSLPISFALPGPGLSLTLGPQLDLVADGDGSGHHLATAQLASLGFPIGPRLSASAEVWANWDFDPAGTVRQYGVSGSLAYLVSNDFQVDAGVVAGLNQAAPDLQLYSGLAFRF